MSRGGVQRQLGAMTVGCASRPNTCRWVGSNRSGRVGGGRDSASRFAADILWLESKLVLGAHMELSRLNRVEGINAYSLFFFSFLILFHVT